MSICLVDTSVFCEILGVPRMSKEHKGYLQELRGKIDAGESLLLPMVAIIETGNHIGQNGDGRQRRHTAKHFVSIVKQAIEGTSPFTPTPFMDSQTLLVWLDLFVDAAAREIGLADLSIQQEWERQRRLNPLRRVYIWSKDQHLGGYDTDPRQQRKKRR